jgi:hypothetical protein
MIGFIDAFFVQSLLIIKNSNLQPNPSSLTADDSPQPHSRSTTPHNSSQSHIATDSQSVSQSVSLSWCRTPSGAYDQKFVYWV